MTNSNISILHKKRFIAIPVLAIVAHYFITNLLYYSVEKLFIDILHIPVEQFVKFIYLGETLVYIILILLFFAFYKLIDKNNNDEIKAKTNCKLSIMSIIAGIGVSGISSLWIMFAEKIPMFQKSIEALNAGSKSVGGGNFIGVILVAVIGGPIIEEILFRGIVFKSIRKITPAWVAILVSSILFGAYHMNLVQIVYASIMGMVAAIIYEKNNNLMFPILVHVGNNFIASLQGFLPPIGVEVLNIFVVIMIFPLGYIIYRLFKGDMGMSQVEVKSL